MPALRPLDSCAGPSDQTRPRPALPMDRQPAANAPARSAERGAPRQEARVWGGLGIGDANRGQSPRYRVTATAAGSAASLRRANLKGTVPLFSTRGRTLAPSGLLYTCLADHAPNLRAGVYHVYRPWQSQAADLPQRRGPPRYLATLGRVTVRMQWRCLSYCMMGNHTHLLVETRTPNLGAGMHRLPRPVRPVLQPSPRPFRAPVPRPLRSEADRDGRTVLGDRRLHRQ